MSHNIAWTLALALTITLGCSQESREQARDEASTAAQGLENAARDGAAAQAARDAEKAAHAAVAEVEAKGAEGSAEAAARDLEGRVERSAEIAKQTYDDSREDGEGRVEAASDAYEAVLEAPDQEAQGGQ